MSEFDASSIPVLDEAVVISDNLSLVKEFIGHTDRNRVSGQQLSNAIPASTNEMFFVSYPNFTLLRFGLQAEVAVPLDNMPVVDVRQFGAGRIIGLVRQSHKTGDLLIVTLA